MGGERMANEQFRELRARTTFTQAKVADSLGYTSRAVAGWESGSANGQRSLPETQLICRLFWKEILSKEVPPLLEKAFATIPSEFVGLWLVRGGEAVISPWSARLYHLPEPGERKKAVQESPTAFPYSEIVCALVGASLTSAPLRNALVKNRTGDDISDDPDKAQKGTRAAQYLKGGQVESLLHVPVFKAGGSGPMPVLLLSMQNKLAGRGGAVINAEEFRKKHGGKADIYTTPDERTALDLAHEFSKKLSKDLDILRMGWPSP